MPMATRRPERKGCQGRPQAVAERSERSGDPLQPWSGGHAVPGGMGSNVCGGRGARGSVGQGGAVRLPALRGSMEGVARARAGATQDRTTDREQRRRGRGALPR